LNAEITDTTEISKITEAAEINEAFTDTIEIEIAD
jgi:hypothetical protein